MPVTNNRKKHDKLANFSVEEISLFFLIKTSLLRAKEYHHRLPVSNRI